jgi:hypothetical protein
MTGAKTQKNRCDLTFDPDRTPSQGQNPQTARKAGDRENIAAHRAVAVFCGAPANA